MRLNHTWAPFFSTSSHRPSFISTGVCGQSRICPSLKQRGAQWNGTVSTNDVEILGKKHRKELEIRHIIKIRKLTLSSPLIPFPVLLAAQQNSYNLNCCNKKTWILLLPYVWKNGIRSSFNCSIWTYCLANLSSRRLSTSSGCSDWNWGCFHERLKLLIRRSSP